jgi:hypothetical protein
MDTDADDVELTLDLEQEPEPDPDPLEPGYRRPIPPPRRLPALKANWP